MNEALRLVARYEGQDKRLTKQGEVGMNVARLLSSIHNKTDKNSAAVKEIYNRTSRIWGQGGAEASDSDSSASDDEDMEGAGVADSREGIAERMAEGIRAQAKLRPKAPKPRVVHSRKRSLAHDDDFAHVREKRRRRGKSHGPRHAWDPRYPSVALFPHTPVTAPASEGVLFPSAPHAQGSGEAGEPTELEKLLAGH